MDQKKGQTNEDRYNFDYFDKMNQKEAQKRETKQAPSAGRKEPQKQQRKAAKQKENQQPKQAKQYPQPTGGKQLPAKAARSPQKQQPQMKQPKSQPKPAPKGDPLPKKPKKYLSAEERKRVVKRRKLLAAMGGVFLALIVVMILCLTVFFRIDTIEVTGASRYSSSQIIEASEIHKGKNLFTLNTGNAGRQVLKALPYVNTISVTRHLPGKIVLEVTDITVVGAVKTGDGYVIIGTNGKMLERVDKLPENCPVLKGATLTKTELGETIEYGSEQQKEALDAFSKALQDGEIDKITAIDISDLFNVKATYDNRIQLEFGSPSDMELKFRFAKTILDSEKISDTQKGTLDLSLVPDKNRAYFDPDYTVASSDDSKDDSKKNDSSDSSSDDTSSEDSSDDTASNTSDNSDSDDDSSNDNGIPDDYEKDSDGFYYGEGGYYDEEGNFYEY